MSNSDRNSIFEAILNGALAAGVQINTRNDSQSGVDANCFLCTAWKLADMAVYHAERQELPADVARRWIKKNYCIVDTETTGLGKDAQIVEIAIVDCRGNTLLDTLVKPTIAIPAEATSIHGITNEMVADAPTWLEVLPRIVELVGYCWIAYNASFDERMIEQSSVDLPHDQHPALLAKSMCAMQLYAEHNGEWDAYRRKYKWKKLTDAATKLKAWPSAVRGCKPHRALFDCYLTLGVIRAIAGEDAQ